MTEKIERVPVANYSVYGARKAWAELNRHGVEVAMCTVERLTHNAGLRGPAPRQVSSHNPAGAGGRKAH